MAKKEKQRAGSLAGPSNTAGGNSGAGEGEVSERRSEQAQPAQQRARVTVVCGECKRLKLKCDRRTPCGACVKRDTTDKCIYASGASEKIDAQFVLNKHTALEQEVEVLKGILQGQQAQISSLQAQLATQQGLSSSQISYEFLYQRQTGSSIMMSFDEMYGMWADQGIDFRPKTPPAAATIALEHEERRDLVSARKRNLSLFEIPPQPIQSRSSSSSSNSSSSRQSAASLANTSPSIGVTTSLVDTLPSEPLRSQIISSLQTTLLLHPTVNFTEFKLRIDGLFRWAEEQAVAKQYNAHFHDPGRRRPSLSLFAAVAAAFALGAQCLTSSSNSTVLSSSTSSSASSPLTPPSSPNEKRKPRDLFVLSAQAVQLHTDAGFQSYDTDIVHALLLQIIYLLHTPANPTGPRRGLELPHELFPIIGSLVNVAKMLGLSRDPDEAPSIVDIGGVSGVAEGKRPMAYSPFVGHERRKLWWCVMFYDLFLSDFMGHKPLICGDFTTRQPTDVDDLRFTVSSTSLPPPTPQSNLQFFLKRCELLLLVQSMKSRYVRDMETGEFSIDEASTFENHVHQILDTLPPRLKVDVDLNHSNTAPLPSTMLPAPSEPAPMASLQSSPPDAVRQPSSAKSDRSTPGTTDRDGYVLAQACELSSIANRIKLKLNLPFLKPKLSEAGVPVPVPRQAILGALNAVHNITHASRLLHSTFRSTRPATLMYYSYSWTLFTAAIVSAHTIIHGQQDHFTSRAMEDVQAALFILRDSSVPTGKDENGRNATSEAVRIPEAMKAKADAKLNPQKRKQREGEEGAAGSSIGPAAKIQAVEAGEGSGSGIGIGAGAMEEMQHLPSQTPELEMAYRMPSESLATPIDGVLPPHFHQQPQQYQQPTQWTGLMGLPAMPLSVDASGMPKMTKDDAAAAAAAKDGKNAHGKPRVGFRNRNAPSKKEGSAPSSPTASTSQSPAASASASVSGSGSGSGSGSAATVGKATSSRKRNLVRATSRQHQQHQQQQQHSERQHSQTHHPAQHVPSQASHHGGQPLHINTSHIPPIYHDVDGPSTPTPTLMYGQSPITFGPSSGHPLSGHSLDVQHSAGGQDGYQRASSTFEHSQPQLHPHPDFVNESNAYGVRYGSQQPQPQQQPQQQSYNGYNHTLTPSATTPQQHFPSMVPQHSMSHSHPSSFAHNPAPQVSEQPSAANFASAASQQGQMVMQNYSVYWDQQHQQPQYASGAMGSQALLPGNATLQQHSESNAASSYLHPGSDFSRSLDVPLESRQEAMDVNMGDQSRFGEPYGWVNPYPGAG